MVQVKVVGYQLICTVWQVKWVEEQVGISEWKTN